MWLTEWLMFSEILSIRSCYVHKCFSCSWLYTVGLLGLWVVFLSADAVWYISDTWGDKFPIECPDWDLIIASDILLCEPRILSLWIIPNRSFVLKVRAHTETILIFQLWTEMFWSGQRGCGLAPSATCFTSILKKWGHLLNLTFNWRIELCSIYLRNW